jgi:hypothetical protein
LVTPIELAIDAELNVEIQRFANDWLFKWHGMNYEGGKTDVEDFLGGRIHFAGGEFGHQQQTIYWQAVDRYLRQKTHSVFRQWDSETQTYSLPTRRSSVDGVERALGRFIAQILSQASETDRRLRGKGDPQNVLPFAQTPGQGDGAGGEVAYLAAAHRALVDLAIFEQTPKVVAPISVWKGIEAFYSDNKGLIWFVTAIVGVCSAGGAALHLLN